MHLKETTYKTLTGPKKIIELIQKKKTQAVIYKDNIPSFFIDCFDLHTEANVLMNSLVLGKKRSFDAIINDIGKKNNVNLSIKKAPSFALKGASEIIELDLPPLPEEWLN